MNEQALRAAVAEYDAEMAREMKAFTNNGFHLLYETPKPDAPAAPLDSFAGIAARLRTVGRELSTLADEIETAALATEQARESAAQDGERLRQLRQLLMGGR